MQKYTCPKCKKDKNETEFTARVGGRRYPDCNTCRRAYKREWMRNKPRAAHTAIWEALYDAMERICRRCDYEEFSSALEFHPLARYDSTPGILLADVVNRYSYNPTQRNWKELLRKLESHTLLCANCRKALRAGDWSIDGLETGPRQQATPPAALVVESAE
jgi:hypothetical protein